MSNHIDCQLKVEGTTARLEELKSSIIKVCKKNYEVDLKLLIQDKLGIKSYDFMTEEDGHLFEVLENSFENFNLNLNGDTFYEWVGSVRFADTAIWVENDWQKFILDDETLIVKFTAAWTPPIAEILLGSLNYPDLKFILSWQSLVDMDRYGTIEGINGCFKAVENKI